MLLASMRPRPESLGSQGVKVRTPSLVLASMRPRPESLGSRHNGQQIKSLSGCFNEAEAGKPRKSAGFPLKNGDTTSFNEAEAGKPRKSRSDRWRLPGAYVASMRPRPESLGSRHNGQQIKSLSGCFNEAEAGKPRKSAGFPLKNGDTTSFNEAEAGKPRKSRIIEIYNANDNMLQ